MIVARTFEGWEARLPARGLARFLGAAFLGFWLCGWAAGEIAACGALGYGTWILLAGEPPPPNLALLKDGAALLAGSGILLWLVLWTYGGMTAAWHFLRLLWGEDRLIARPDGLKVIRRAWLFSKTRDLPRGTLRRLYRRPGNNGFMVETTSGLVELTSYVDSAELATLEVELTRELGLDSAPTPDGLPNGWEEISVREGGSALVKSPRERRIQGVIAAVVAVALFGALGAVALSLPGHPEWRAFLAVLAVGTGLAAWAAVRLNFGRSEWKWRQGRVRLDWRFRGNVRTVFEGAWLELRIRSDSDNDHWYELDVLVSRPDQSAPAKKSPHRKTVVSVMRDPLVPRRLGEWLGRRAGLPLDDRTGVAAAEVDVLRKKLEASGKLGSWMAKMIPPQAGRK